MKEGQLKIAWEKRREKWEIMPVNMRGSFINQRRGCYYSIIPTW